MAHLKTGGIVLLVVGIILLGFGINAANAPMEEFGEALTGQYSDNTMMYLVAGAVCTVLGLVGMLKK